MFCQLNRFLLATLIISYLFETYSVSVIRRHSRTSKTSIYRTLKAIRCRDIWSSKRSFILLSSMDSQIPELNITEEKSINEELSTNAVSVINEEPLKLVSNYIRKDGLVIYYHPFCELHDIPDHPEQPNRVTYILNKLKASFDSSIFKESTLIKDEFILLFHTNKLLSLFVGIARQCETLRANNKYAYKKIDSDTVLMWHTREAAYAAAGAVINAIDDIFSYQELNPNSNQLLTAFCCVRPPGHHAERGNAMGFCFLNNIGIGAKYVKSKYGLKKIAILDFDVHHGNGSEEGVLDDDSIFFGSTHEKNNYPGTGVDFSPHVGEKARNPIDRRIVNRWLQSGSSSRNDFRIKWKEIIEEMILFLPEIIFISAGFDAHDDDPLSDTELTTEDFAWATQFIIDASRKINHDKPPPIISSLEGGYDLNALSDCALIHAKTLSNSNIPSNNIGNDESSHSGDEVAALISHLSSINVI